MLDVSSTIKSRACPTCWNAATDAVFTGLNNRLTLILDVGQGRGSHRGVGGTGSVTALHQECVEIVWWEKHGRHGEEDDSLRHETSELTEFKAAKTVTTTKGGPGHPRSQCVGRDWAWAWRRGSDTHAAACRKKEAFPVWDERTRLAFGMN